MSIISENENENIDYCKLFTLKIRQIKNKIKLTSDR